MNTLHKLTRSSEDPHQLSLTIRGLLTSFIPIAMLLFGLTEAELQPIIDGVVQIIFLATSLVAGLQATWGLLRKTANGRWTAAE